MNFDVIYQFLADLGYTHPLHPTITHLTIGLVMGAMIFQLIALLPRYNKYAQTAKHCSALAFLAVFPTVILGLMDWSYYYGANWIFPIKMKFILAGILALLLLLSIILNTKPSRAGALTSVYLLSFATVVGLGYFGGEIVFGKTGAQGTETQISLEKRKAPIKKPASVDFAVAKSIFQDNCTNCHTGDNPPKSLNLTSYINVMEGSQTGPVVVPGNPGESELIKRVKGISTPQMPLAGAALSDNDIQALEKWIHDGALGPKS